MNISHLMWKTKDDDVRECYEPIHETKPIVAAAKNDLLVQFNLHLENHGIIDKLMYSREVCKGSYMYKHRMFPYP